MGRALKEYYTREHPIWPSNEVEALDEISEINDLLDKGGWSKGQRDWAYDRRKKLVRYIRDEAYRSHTGGVRKAMETVEDKRDEALKEFHPTGCQCGACIAMRNREGTQQQQVEESNG